MNPTASRPSHRATPPLLCGGAARWAELNGAPSRAAALATLDALRAAGHAKLWGTFQLAPRPVSLRELCQTTRLDEKLLDPSAAEISLEQIQDSFVKLLLGSTLVATVWAGASDALGLDAGLRFGVTYLLAGLPIGVVAIGSVAPSILFLPVEAFRAATASEEERRMRSERVCRHEASHLLCAYVLGLPIQEVGVGDKGPRVVVYDEEAAQQPGVLVSERQVNSLAVVAVSGLMAEAEAFGKAFGASEDLKLLGRILMRSNPPIPAQKQQDLTRYAALIAWTIIKKHSRAYDAISTALAAGKGLGDCLQAAEQAEAEGALLDMAAAAAKAEAMKKETPQERAAREREEMGWSQ